MTALTEVTLLATVLFLVIIVAHRGFLPVARLLEWAAVDLFDALDRIRSRTLCLMAALASIAMAFAAWALALAVAVLQEAVVTWIVGAFLGIAGITLFGIGLVGGLGSIVLLVAAPFVPLRRLTD